MSSSAVATRLCRVCANPSDDSTMFRLFDEHDEQLPIAEAFRRVSEIRANDEPRLPQICCQRCRDRLQEVVDLRAVCLESDRKLRKMLGFELKEEDGQDERLAILKVELIEVAESFSCWDDMENRSNGSNSDMKELPGTTETKKTMVKCKKKKSYEENDVKMEEITDETLNFDPGTVKDKTKRVAKKRFTSMSLEKRTAKSKEKTPKAPETFQCTLCGKIYKSRNSLREHETSHFPDRMNHKCHICSEEFARRNYYLRHLKMHQTENQFKCNECDKTYSFDKHLQEHIRTKHRGERPFRCKICSKSFPRVCTLNKHVQAVHEKIKRKIYKCDICTRMFENKHGYERHVNSHKGIKQNQCPHCGNKYEFKAYLLQHIAEKHPETVPNLTRCQFCGLGYSTDGYHRKHIVKRHPEHLQEFDQWMKAKRDEMLAGNQSTNVSSLDYIEATIELK